MVKAVLPEAVLPAFEYRGVKIPRVVGVWSRLGHDTTTDHYVCTFRTPAVFVCDTHPAFGGGGDVPAGEHAIQSRFTLARSVAEGTRAPLFVDNWIAQLNAQIREIIDDEFKHGCTPIAPETWPCPTCGAQRARHRDAYRYKARSFTAADFTNAPGAIVPLPEIEVVPCPNDRRAVGAPA